MLMFLLDDMCSYGRLHRLFANLMVYFNPQRSDPHSTATYAVCRGGDGGHFNVS